MVRSVKRRLCQEKRSGKWGAEACYCCRCFTGCVPNLIYQCAVEDVGTVTASLLPGAKKEEEPGKQSMLQKRRTAPEMLEPTHLRWLLPGGITSGKSAFATDAIQTTCKLASRQHLILPSRNCHINTRLTGILKRAHAGKKLRNPQKNILGNGIISPGFMMKTSTGRAHCRAQPSKHPLRASFPPEISAYAVAAIKCFKNTAWTINRASRQSTDQQISWKHSIKYHSAFKL